MCARLSGDGKTRSMRGLTLLDGEILDFLYHLSICFPGGRLVKAIQKMARVRRRGRCSSKDNVKLVFMLHDWAVRRIWEFQRCIYDTNIANAYIANMENIQSA